ncbi:MAG: hybrid sensor histidine kinase/response regulator [Thermodesulfobacteriota bacterium]
MRRAANTIEQARKLVFENGTPVRLLTFGILLNLVLLSVVGLLVWSMYRSLSTIGNQELSLQRLVGSIAYLHEVLTDSARMGAATGDPGWEARYREFEPELDRAILQAAMLARQEYEKNYAAQTKLAYTKLIEMENLALALVRDSRPREAAAVLFGAEYDRQKALYSEGLNKMSEAIRGRTGQEIQFYRARLWQAGLGALFSLLILLFAWVAVLVAMKRHLKRRRLAEENVFEAKERLAIILESIADGVIATDTIGRIVLMNSVAEELTGWKRPAAMGKRLNKVLGIVQRTSRATDEDTGVMTRRGMRDIGLIDGPSTLRGSDGSERLIEYASAPIRNSDDKVQGLVLVIRDVTERRRLQHELLKVEKLESLGLLAGGIAHDFNNLLTGILGNVSLAKLLLSPGHKALERLTAAETGGARARDLTYQLLTFSRGGAPIKKTVAVPRLLSDWTRFALRGSAVDCAFDMDTEHLWPVDLDEGQISQVINNLVINACQAMPGGGTLKVSAYNFILSPEDAIPLRAGRYVKICVADTGVGIEPENLERIFDPYFTTKPNGIGLGLSASYAAVRRHSGHISVRSEVGAGTTFTIYLPASDPGARVPPSKTVEPLRGSGRVLVMDDEEMVRDLARTLLERLGYTVGLAGDGDEVVRVYAEAIAQGTPFDVVIMDLTIPGGTGGKQAITQLRRLDPKVKAIVSSGYSNDPIMAQFRNHGFAAVLAKPYSAGEMSEVLRIVLRDGASADLAVSLPLLPSAGIAEN